MKEKCAKAGSPYIKFPYSSELARTKKNIFISETRKDKNECFERAGRMEKKFRNALAVASFSSVLSLFIIQSARFCVAAQFIIPWFTKAFFLWRTSHECRNHYDSSSLFLCRRPSHAG